MAADHPVSDLAHVKHTDKEGAGHIEHIRRLLTGQFGIRSQYSHPMPVRQMRQHPRQKHHRLAWHRQLLLWPVSHHDVDLVRAVWMATQVRADSIKSV